MITTKFALGVALGLIALVAAPADANTITTYTIDFTGTVQPKEPALPTGSFTYDSTNPQFTNFLVTWNGHTFDLTASANSPTIRDSAGNPLSFSDAAHSFLLLSQDPALFPPFTWQIPVDFNLVPGRLDFTANLSTAANSSYIDIRALGRPISCVGPCRTFSDSWTITPTTTTPEPSSLILLGTGILGLTGMGLYKKRLA